MRNIVAWGGYTYGKRLRNVIDGLRTLYPQVVMLEHLYQQLYVAAETGNATLVQALIAQKVPVEICLSEDGKEDAGGRSPLYLASREGHITVVKLLLAAGANPNSKNLESELTALHAAAHFGHSHVVQLLLDYHANPHVENIDGESAIDVANDSLTIKLLVKAGAIKKINKIQSLFINNINLLVNELVKRKMDSLPTLNQAGVCDGLSKLYILYEKQQRGAEFEFYITFINGLSTADISKLAKKYAINHHLKIKLNHKKGEIYLFEDLISFVTAVYKTYETQSQTHYKSIGANWDATHIIVCSKRELGRHLVNKNKQKDKVKADHFKLIATPRHKMALHFVGDNIFFYDPNNPKGIECCQDEEELAKLIIKNSSKESDVIVVCIDDISYGNENRFIDDLLVEYSDILQGNADLQVWAESYRNGNLSRRELAFCLDRHLHSNDLAHQELKTQLSVFLAGNPSHSFILDTIGNGHYSLNDSGYYLFNYVLDNSAMEFLYSLVKEQLKEENFIKKTGPELLHYAVFKGDIALALFILTLGVDINQRDKSGGTILHRCITNYISDPRAHPVKEIIPLLLRYGADPTIATYKNVTPHQLAAYTGNNHLLQMLPPAISTQEESNQNLLKRLFVKLLFTQTFYDENHPPCQQQKNKR